MLAKKAEADFAKIECPECDGYGIRTGEPHTCRVCGGEGEFDPIARIKIILREMDDLNELIYARIAELSEKGDLSENE